MSNSLYKLFMDYKGRELDDSFINQAYELMMEKETSLAPYVNDLDLKYTDDNLGAYNYAEKIIRVNKDKILSEDAVALPDKKLLTLRVLRHEIEHARNYKRLFERRNDIESEIIRYSLADFVSRLDSENMSPSEKLDLIIKAGKKKENYMVDPEERLADIRAGQYLVNLLKNQNRTPELLMVRSMLYYAYIRGYSYNGYYLNPPTYQFLLKMGMYRDYYLLKKKVEEKCERMPWEAPKKEMYSFDTRITYGLPISIKEFDDEIIEKVKLVKIKKDN